MSETIGSIKQRGEHNEVFNASSHFAGFLLSVAGLVALVALAAISKKSLHVISFSIYGATLCLLYFSSSVYHFFCISDSGRIRKILQRLDHCAIYLLIAGSYTPLCLVVLKGGWGWSLFGIIWGLAISGIVMKLLIKNPDNVFTYAMYGIMGWLAVIAVPPMAKVMSLSAMSLLFAGGVSYTVGAVLLALKKPRIKPGVFSYHELWHLFVMAGSFLHFALMFFFVLPKYK